MKPPGFLAVRALVVARCGPPAAKGADGVDGSVRHATWWRGVEPWSLSLTETDDGLELDADAWVPGADGCRKWPLSGPALVPVAEALDSALGWLAERGHAPAPPEPR